MGPCDRSPRNETQINQIKVSKQIRALTAATVSLVFGASCSLSISLGSGQVPAQGASTSTNANIPIKKDPLPVKNIVNLPDNPSTTTVTPPITDKGPKALKVETVPESERKSNDEQGDTSDPWNTTNQFPAIPDQLDANLGSTESPGTVMTKAAVDIVMGFSPLSIVSLPASLLELPATLSKQKVLSDLSKDIRSGKKPWDLIHNDTYSEIIGQIFWHFYGRCCPRIDSFSIDHARPWFGERSNDLLAKLIIVGHNMAWIETCRYLLKSLPSITSTGLPLTGGYQDGLPAASLSQSEVDARLAPGEANLEDCINKQLAKMTENQKAIIESKNAIQPTALAYVKLLQADQPDMAVNSMTCSQLMIKLFQHLQANHPTLFATLMGRGGTWALLAKSEKDPNMERAETFMIELFDKMKDFPIVTINNFNFIDLSLNSCLGHKGEIVKNDVNKSVDVNKSIEEMKELEGIFSKYTPSDELKQDTVFIKLKDEIVNCLRGRIEYYSDPASVSEDVTLFKKYADALALIALYDENQSMYSEPGKMTCRDKPKEDNKKASEPSLGEIVKDAYVSAHNPYPFGLIKSQNP